MTATHQVLNQPPPLADWNPYGAFGTLPEGNDLGRMVDRTPTPGG